MRKPAPSDRPLHDLIADRWSPRAFSSRIPAGETLARLFEAARWAPSAFNEQPWRFIIATKDNTEEYGRLLACLVEANRAWAVLAPVLGILVTKKTFTKNGKPNPWAQHDGGMALENLMLQAVAEGMFAHGMGGFDPDKVRETYNVPEDFKPTTAFALGYPGDPAQLSVDYREMELAPRERKPLEELVFSGRWEMASPTVKP